MSSEDMLKAAVTHWGARVVANGVALTDFEDITKSLTSYDDWCKAWVQRGALHEKIGREALASKHFLTAGECLQRAAVYYHFGSFLFAHKPDEMKAAHKKQIVSLGGLEWSRARKRHSLRPWAIAPGRTIAKPL